ncbi:MAG: M28 family peptidase [Bacteroidales bacterium]|nr:M28 family peptidase [Bacteroidales bacterium]
MKRFLKIAVIFIAGLAFSSELFAQKADKGTLSINPAQIKEYVYYLASDSLKGRKTPGKELDMAADYIAEKFKDYGLETVGGSYFQTIPYFTQDLDVSNTRFSIDGKSFELKSDFIPFEAASDMNPEGDFKAEVVFAGYGITAPEYGYDDYAGLDVNGKFVLVLKSEPRKNDPESPFMGTNETKHSKLIDKVRNAKAHGAIGLLFVTDPLNHMMLKPQGYPWQSLSKLMKNSQLPFQVDTREANGIPTIHVGDRVVEKLFGSVDSLKTIQAGIDKTLKPHSFIIERSMCELKVSLLINTTTAKNVVGMIKGSDKKLRGEVVIIGGHYDHVGCMLQHKEGEDYIYNGADDNASGTAGVMAVAKAFASNRKAPARSLLFICFAGEEMGLIGSEYYTKHPLLPVEKSVAMLNMDMIGRNGTDTLQLEGADLNPDLRDIMLKENVGLGLKYVPTGNEMMGRSDHYNFFKLGITSVDITGGLHPDYHTVRDNPDKLDCDKASRIATLVYRTARVIASESRRYKVEPLK